MLRGGHESVSAVSRPSRYDHKALCDARSAISVVNSPSRHDPVNATSSKSRGFGLSGQSAEQARSCFPVGPSVQSSPARCLSGQSAEQIVSAVSLLSKHDHLSGHRGKPPLSVVSAVSYAEQARSHISGIPVARSSRRSAHRAGTITMTPSRISAVNQPSRYDHGPVQGLGGQPRRADTITLRVWRECPTLKRLSGQPAEQIRSPKRPQEDNERVVRLRRLGGQPTEQVRSHAASARRVSAVTFRRAGTIHSQSSRAFSVFRTTDRPAVFGCQPAEQERSLDRRSNAFASRRSAGRTGTIRPTVLPWSQRSAHRAGDDH
jgi:hypothetical protein